MTESGSVIASLNELMTGDYAPFIGGVVDGRDVRSVVPAGNLLDADMQSAIHARFSARFDTFDARAAHSIWMKWYLNVWIPPYLLADLLLERRIDPSLDMLGFIIGQDTRIAAVKLFADVSGNPESSPFVRFDSLIFDHFAPLIGFGIQ